MPLILEFTFEDGSTEEKRIPAEIWRQGEESVSKVFVFEKPLKDIELDPRLETADTDRNNNYWPTRREPTRFELYKSRQDGRSQENPMQRAQRAAGN